MSPRAVWVRADTLQPGERFAVVDVEAVVTTSQATVFGPLETTVRTVQQQRGGKVLVNGTIVLDPDAIVRVLPPKNPRTKGG